MDENALTSLFDFIPAAYRPSGTTIALLILIGGRAWRALQARGTFKDFSFGVFFADLLKYGGLFGIIRAVLFGENVPKAVTQEVKAIKAQVQENTETISAVAASVTPDSK